jgi:denticleless
MGLAFSPCGRYLASGSARGGLMTWDTASREVQGYNRSPTMTVVNATKLGMGQTWDGTGKEREVNAVDWGYDMVSFRFGR